MAIALFYVLVFLTGLALGSFINSWVWRARENCRIITGRSICVHCHRQLNWYENIPVLSYLCLSGVCRTCHHPIPRHYIWVEIFFGFLFLFVFWYYDHYLGFGAERFVGDSIFIVFLWIIFIFDLFYKEIPVATVWLGVAFSILFNYFVLNYSLGSMFLGALLAGGFFAAQYCISRGGWIGGGDVRLGVLMGVWL